MRLSWTQTVMVLVTRTSMRVKLHRSTEQTPTGRSHGCVDVFHPVVSTTASSRSGTMNACATDARAGVVVSSMGMFYIVVFV